jgi:hypothetical protein
MLIFHGIVLPKVTGTGLLTLPRKMGKVTVKVTGTNFFTLFSNLVCDIISISLLAGKSYLDYYWID